MTTERVTVKDFGPIVDTFEFDLPDGGGVVRMRGRNGSGKSTIINGLSQLMGSPARSVSVNDEAKGAGSITLGTATLRVTSSKSRTVGTVELESVDARFDIGELVNPRFKDAEAADNHRMKTLVALSGRKATPDDFAPLCDETITFESLAVEPTDETLTLASRVKSGFERIARGFEAEQRKLSARAEAGKQQIADLDLTIETDERRLAEAFANATSDAARMEQHNIDAARAIKAAETARKELESLAAETDDPDQLEREETAVREKIVAKRSAIDRIKADISQLEHEIDTIELSIRTDHKNADDLLNRKVQARRAAFRRSQIAAAASESVPTLHTPQELDDANRAVLEAQRAMEAGAVIRRAKQTAADAQRDADLAAEKAKAADDLRRRAAGVDDVLSSMLPEGCPLRYKRGRLVVGTDRDDAELFADLSHGERWRLAFETVKPLLPPGRSVLLLPQEGWESLDPQNQAMVNETAKACGLWVVTGEAADCDLTAEVFPTAAG